MSKPIQKSKIILIADKCPNCFYGNLGTFDFKFNIETGFIVCPKCKTRWKI